MLKKLLVMLSFLTVVFVVAACGQTDEVIDDIIDDLPGDDIIDDDNGDIEEDEPEEDEEEVLNIPETAIEADDFEILVQALVEAELVDALTAEGPFTVFAPSDEAFGQLLTDLELTAEELLGLENLSDILLYHVVAGEFLAEDVIALATDGPVEVETLLGETITISLEDGNVLVNGVTVILPDVVASNGVIHVIDYVLLPPAEEAE